jgi:hypothetical protein
MLFNVLGSGFRGFLFLMNVSGGFIGFYKIRGDFFL